MADLDAASLEDFANFFKTYYAPNNAVLAIAGDVDPKIALEKARKYFEAIPSGPPRRRSTRPSLRRRKSAGRSINDPLARLTLVDIAYQVPGGINADMDALSPRSRPSWVPAAARGCTTASCGSSSSPCRRTPARPAEGPDVHLSGGHGGAGQGSGRRSRRRLYAEVDKIQTGPIQEWELDKARNAARRSLVGSLGSSLQRAILLARYAVFYNDPGVINTRYERIAVVDDRRICSASPGNISCPRTAR